MGEALANVFIIPTDGQTMPDHRERILELASKGPLLPMQVAKTMGVDSIMASAMLSELVSKNLLKVSHVKIGSSPLYYDAKHPEVLEDYTKNLNEKEQKAIQILKEKTVLRDKDLEPLPRVCLRNAKDFAHPLEVQWEGNTELFWKYFLLPDEDAETKIKQILTPKKEVKIEDATQEKPEKAHNQEPEQSPEPEKKATERTAKNPEAKMPPETPAQKQEKTETQVKLSRPKTVAAFAKALEAFLEQNEIEIIETLQEKKNEFELIVEVPSQVGKITHYCKAKKKAKVNDADVGQAYLQGQIRKLPVLFIVQGETTKKLEEILLDLKGIVVKRL